MNKLILLALIFFPFFAGAFPETLTGRSVKAFFVTPLSPYLRVADCHIDLFACRYGNCETLVDRIPGSDLKSRGEITLRFERGGSMAVIYHSQDQGAEILLARLPYENGWYRPSELCPGGANASCHYHYERDQESHSLALRVISRPAQGAITNIAVTERDKQ